MLLTVYACYALKNSRCNATAAWPRNILHRNFPTSTLCIYKNTPRWGRVYFLADGEGFPRTALARRLRGNRDDLTALHWSNLLVVEQGFSSAPPIHKINAPLGRVYFMADGEGFPRTMLTHRLRGNRDDLTALHWSNLLVVEPGVSHPPHRSIK